MGACQTAEQSKTIRVARPQIQKAVIKDTNTQVVTDAVVPRVSQNQADLNTAAKVWVQVSIGRIELELNETIDEPWVCMGDNEADGCMNDSPEFMPGMGSRYSS